MGFTILTLKYLQMKVIRFLLRQIFRSEAPFWLTEELLCNDAYERSSENSFIVRCPGNIEQTVQFTTMMYVASLPSSILKKPV